MFVDNFLGGLSVNNDSQITQFASFSYDSEVKISVSLFHLLTLTIHCNSATFCSQTANTAIHLYAVAIAIANTEQLAFLSFSSCCISITNRVTIYTL